jgi:hypothetical protein
LLGHAKSPRSAKAATSRAMWMTWMITSASGWGVIDGVRAVERHPQARRELFAAATGKRDMAQRLEMCLDRCKNYEAKSLR